jgi:hypothetical protein
VLPQLAARLNRAAFFGAMTMTMTIAMQAAVIAQVAALRHKTVSMAVMVDALGAATAALERGESASRAIKAMERVIMERQK